MHILAVCMCGTYASMHIFSGLPSGMYMFVPANTKLHICMEVHTQTYTYAYLQAFAQAYDALVSGSDGMIAESSVCIYVRICVCVDACLVYI